jgi:hypothetical protein
MAENKKDIDVSSMSIGEITAKLRKMVSDGELDSKMFETLLSAANDRGNEMSQDEALDFYNLAEEVQSGEMSEAFKNKLGNNKAKQLLREFATVGSAISDLAIAGAQIAEGEASSNVPKPTAPPRYRLDPAISSQINRSFQGINPAAINTQLAPVQQEIQDAYQADINNAKLASGGQAGSFGALGQAAVNRRMRNAGQLGSLRQQIRESGMRNIDNALRNRLGERQMQQARDMSVYNTNLNQYNAEQQAAGALEQAGRINKRSSVNNLMGSLMPLADKAIDSKAIGNLSKRLFGGSNSSGIKDSGVNDSIRNDIYDFDADDSSLMKYNEALDRDLFMNQFRGIG